MPILRGAIRANGKNEPNYHYEHLLEAIAAYEKLGLSHPFIMVDTNHDNSEQAIFRASADCSLRLF